MTLFLILSWSTLVIYAGMVGRRLVAWQKMPVFRKAEEPAFTSISVLIPVRNEAAGIQALLQDLAQQTYDRALFEVLVLDDHSEDETVALVTRFQAGNDLKIQLIRLADYPGLQQKKAAIAQGVTLAVGTLIIQTDGDCRVPPEWLATFAHYHETTAAKCISGPVGLTPDGSWFAGMQLVEFAALIGIGGASIALGRPNMCNGANLAYTRATFLEVQGLAGNEHVASGDDEFLMHKIAVRYPGQVAFLKAPAAIVLTAAKKSVKAFLEQRVRWASKWPYYRKIRIKLLAFLVFGINLLLFFGILFALPGQITGWEIALLYAFKLAIDGLFLAPVLQFFNRRNYLIYILPLQLVYVPYVIFTALKGLRGNYHWKGRQVSLNRGSSI